MDWVLALGIAALLLGFVLAAVEMVVPGFGVPGISSIVCLVIGVFLVSDSPLEGALTTLFVLVVLGVMLVVVLCLFSKGKLSPLVLKEKQSRTEGYLSSADLEYLLGKQGTALTDLRPSGTGVFDDIKFDVVSEGSYIEKGASLRIVRVDGLRLVVREYRE